MTKSGKNKLAIFRFNPGKEKVLFPPAHPYTKVKGASAATAATSVAAPKHEIANLDELNDKMKELASAHPEWFDKGFKELKVETGAGNNGSTDGRGNIWLTNQRINHVIDAFNNISNGNKTTLDQEDALSTLWHEITHNMHKATRYRLTKGEKMYMELANEFVARNTLKNFMKDIGGELQNEALTQDRQSTGYNTMVRNYDQLISWSKADKTKVLETVQKHLLDESYSDQLTGLINGLKTHSQYKIKNVRALIATARSLSTSNFKNHLDALSKSLVEKGSKD